MNIVKKSIAFLGVTSLMTSSTSVVGCTYVNFYKQSIENKINELVSISQLAMYPAIAGAAGTDGKAANTELKSKKVSDFTSLIQDSTVGNALSGYFGNDFNIFSTINSNSKNADDTTKSDTERYKSSVDGLSDSDVKDMYGEKYQTSGWNTIYGAFNSVYGIVGQGLSSQLASTLVSLLGNMGLNSAQETIDNAVTKIANVFTDIDTSTIETHFEEQNKLVKTNQDYLYWVFADLSEYFNASIKNSDGTNLFTLSDLQKISDNSQWDVITTKLGNCFNTMFNDKTNWASNTQELITCLPNILYALSKYIEAFDSYQNSDVSSKDKLSGDDFTHLFSSEKTNYEMELLVSKEAVKASSKDKKLSTASFNGLASIVSLITGSYGSEYNFNRVLQILFNSNDKSDNLRLIGTPISGDGTISPKYDDNSNNGIIFQVGTDGYPKKSFIIGNESQYSLGLEPIFSSLADGLLSNFLNKTYLLTIIKWLNLVFGWTGTDLYQLLGNLISSILANNNVSELVSSLPTDYAGLYNSKVISSLSALIKNAGITLPDPSVLESAAPILKIVSGFMNHPFEDLLFGDTLLPTVYSLIEQVMKIEIPDDIKKIKNLTSLLNAQVEIMGVGVSLNDVLPIVLQLVPFAVANLDEFVSLIKKAAEPPGKYKFVFYDGNLQKQDDNSGKSDTYGIYFSSRTYGTTLSLALSLIRNSIRGYTVTGTGYDSRTSVNTVAKKLLGFISKDDPDKNNYTSSDSSGTIEKDSIFGHLQALLNSNGNASLQRTLINIKTFLDSKSGSYSKQKANILDGYISSKNFSTSNITYDNFTDNKKKSSIDYDLNYSYNDKKLSYHIQISVDPSVSKLYKITQIKKNN